jgi:hypothetical protein
LFSGGGSLLAPAACEVVYGLDFHSEILCAGAATMWHYQLYRWISMHLENLDFHQVVVFVIVIVVFGFFCLSGFGSRSKY